MPWIPVQGLDDGRKSEVTRYAFLAVPMAFAVGDWFAVAQRRRQLEYVCKPATIIALLICVWLWMGGPHDAWQARFFLPGLGFSLAGDVLLMLRRERLFVYGLGAFLLAHVSYVIGFNPTVPPSPSFTILIPIAAAEAVIVRRIGRGLGERDAGAMLSPMVAYGFAIGLMLFSAWATLLRPGWGAPRAGLAVIGGSLFFISDVLLAWDRFVNPLHQGRLWVHATYHLGQMALAASILLPMGVQ